MISSRILIAGVAAMVALTSCLSTTAPGVSHYGSGPRRILFVGNSLSAANDLPSMVVALAESASVSPLPQADLEWQPNFALIDHLTAGLPQPIISSGHYDFVILQQGPTSVEINRDSLRLWTKMFDPLIRSAGGLPVLLSVWPSSDRAVDFDRSTESYQLAAHDVAGTMVPGGEVWRAAWRRDATLPLYGPDGFHPSALGSYAVALSIVSTLYDRSAVGLPAKIRVANGAILSIDPTVARLLQEATDEANQHYGFKGKL
jgi:hypothetical protein